MIELIDTLLKSQPSDETNLKHFSIFHENTLSLNYTLMTMSEGNMRSVGSGKEGVIRKTAYNTRYTLAEIARLLRELLVTPSPRMNMLGISVEMLEHTNVLRCYLTGVCEEINKVNGIDDEQRAAIDEIITTHRDHKYASKYNIAVKAIKMLVSGVYEDNIHPAHSTQHIHETNLTELTPKRPETVKLRDKYLPHKDENGAERNEIYYYAIKAKKMVNECRRVGLGDKEVLERLYGNEELSRRKREIIDIALPFLQKYLDRCEHDWVYVTWRFNLIERGNGESD